MHDIRIKYIAPVYDGSGYAEAARNYVVALHTAGVPVSVKPISFERSIPNIGPMKDIIDSLVDIDGFDHNVTLVHATPENMPRLFSDFAGDSLKVGYSAWETTKIPDRWINLLNSADLNLVPCTMNSAVYSECGVKTPIEVVPHCINAKVNLTPVNKEKITITDIDEAVAGKYVFYTVAQYNERKNIDSLLRAFWNAFDGIDGVALVVKTYPMSGYGPTSSEKLMSHLARVKAEASPKNPPEVHFIFDKLSSDDIVYLHQLGDCFVSLHRGEGFGMPILEAACQGNAIVTTGFGGPSDFLDSQKAFFVDYTFEPVYGIAGVNDYNCSQFWAHPDVLDAITKMKHIYYNQADVHKIAAGLRVDVAMNYTYAPVAKKMVEAIRKHMVKK